MDGNRKTNVEHKRFVKLGTWAVVLSIGAMVLMGQITVAGAEPAVAVVAASTMAETEADEAEMQESLTSQSIQTISFKKDMPITDALRMLAQMYQKNIVPSAAVDGIVTVTNLYDVTFEEAMQAILGTHKYEIKGNFIKVYTNDEFMQDKSRFENAIISLSEYDRSLLCFDK